MSRNSLSRRGRPDRGFTLIEALVAFAILAVSLAVLTGAFSTGLGGIEKSERYVTATLLARSALEQVGISIPVVPGELSRSADNGLVLRLRIAPTSAAPAAPLNDGVVVPYEVTAFVEWSGGAMSLTTLRLAQESAVDAEIRRAGSSEAGEGPTR